jgi:hypothetical protein
MELKNLKAIFYRESQVLEIYHENKLVVAEVMQENDMWFGAELYEEEYDYNFFVDENGKATLGMFECEPTHPEQTPWTNFKTGNFIHNVPLQII